MRRVDERRGEERRGEKRREDKLMSFSFITLDNIQKKTVFKIHEFRCQLELVLSRFWASLSTDLLLDPGQSLCHTGVDSGLTACTSRIVNSVRSCECGNSNY